MQSLLGGYSKWKTSCRLQTTIIGFLSLGRCNTATRHRYSGGTNQHRNDMCRSALWILCQFLMVAYFLMTLYSLTRRQLYRKVTLQLYRSY
jgi:hypothetical protein